MHHLSSADKIIALKGGRIAHLGTYSELVVTGYDLTGDLVPTSSSHDAKKTTSKEGKDGASELATAGPSEKQSEDDDETLQSYDKGGMTAYKFYVAQVGVSRILSVGLFIALYSAMRLGVQVRF